MSIGISPRYRKIILVMFGLLTVAIVLLGIVYYQGAQSGKLEVIFLDIGQGDSILIKTPDHQNIVIDGGPDSTILSKLGRNLSFYDRTIDLMVLTHPHEDHVAGLVEVMKRYNVHKVLYTGVEYASSTYTEWWRTIQEKNIPPEIAKDGKRFIFGEKLSMEVLYPLDDISGERFKDQNDSSVVAKLVYGETSFLFMGDAPVEVENKLLQSGNQGGARAPPYPSEWLKSDVLKVGHHGSRYSSGEEFLRAVNPKYAVIQSGKGNEYGHPHLSTLRKLDLLGIEVLRNDELGDIKIQSDGTHVWMP